MYFEDLAVGQTYFSSRHVVTEEEIIGFARQFDPQPFHTNPAAATTSFFGRLCASGWHTAAVTMRLFVTSDFDLHGGKIGGGVESLRWPVPTHPGDELRVEAEIVETRLSRSKPDRGWIRVQVTTRNQRDEIAQQMIASMVVARRPDRSTPVH